MLARELTSLDLVCGGRSILCFAPPFAEPLAEAITLCRALWREGEVASDGPQFPVRARRNRARPAGEHSPLIALDLTGGDEAGSLGGPVDLVLRPTADPRSAAWSACDGRHRGAGAARAAAAMTAVTGRHLPALNGLRGRGGDRRRGLPPPARLGLGRLPRG